MSFPNASQFDVRAALGTAPKWIGFGLGKIEEIKGKESTPAVYVFAHY